MTTTLEPPAGVGRHSHALPILDVEAELARFELEERARLGLEPEAPTARWSDPKTARFLAKERDKVTILVSGLTVAHDIFLTQAMRGLGYNVQTMDAPDNASFRFGKEFGNRGQCNPTYFTVGNLVKFLSRLRDEESMTAEQIKESYVYLTPGACGPCRFGTYTTEYRKALRDAGFDGFRVVIFEQQGGMEQSGNEDGLDMGAPFFWAMAKAFTAGDALNALTYRVRPYEVVPGATDAALEESKRIISEALSEGRLLGPALWKVRKLYSAIEVDRTQAKPKVAIIGEFWAMTTEGDGNYRLQRFLEEEGAEVDIQLLTAWLLYNIWELRYDTAKREDLKREDSARLGLEGVNVLQRKVTLYAAEKVLRGFFQLVANTMGLHGYHLPDMDELAEISHDYYDNNLRGGEGHMEVGKLIQNVVHNKVNMTLSVKPFGCMPSSGVSDGVQAKITELYPKAIYCPIETSGDGAVNVQSRVQMMLFKARQAAREEAEAAYERYGTNREEVQRILRKVPGLGHALFKAPHSHGSTAADVAELAGRLRRWWPKKAQSDRRNASSAARSASPSAS